MKKYPLFAAVAAGLSVAPSFNIHAATVQWSLPSGTGLFTDSANWAGGSLPLPEDTAINNIAGSTTLIQDGDDITVNTLQANAGSLSITGGTLQTFNLQITGDGHITQSGGNIINTADARVSANGSWNITGGNFNLNKMVIGSTAPAINAAVTVSGSAVVVQDQTGGSGIARELWIGGNNGGSGSLILKDDAIWMNTNTNATAGANPVVAVGNNGSGKGTLTIQDRASFTYQNVVRVATNANNVGTINLNGGTINVAGFQRGGGTGTINANGGTLVVTKTNSDPVTNLFNGFTGTGGVDNNSVNLLAGGLKLNTNGLSVTVSNTLSGVGGLTKQGEGILIVTGVNTYSGGTILEEGLLEVGADATLGKGNVTVLDTAMTLIVDATFVNPFNPSITLSLAGGGDLGADVGFLTVTGDVTVGSLILGGEVMAPGVYTEITSPEFIAGPGSVIVTAVPEPATIAMLGLGVLFVLHRARGRRRVA